MRQTRPPICPREIHIRAGRNNKAMNVIKKIINVNGHYIDMYITNTNTK